MFRAVRSWCHPLYWPVKLNISPTPAPLLLQLDEPCRMSVFNRKARLVPVVLQLGEFGFHPEETKEHQLVNGHFLSCSSALSTSLSKKSGITHFCTVASF